MPGTSLTVHQGQEALKVLHCNSRGAAVLSHWTHSRVAHMTICAEWSLLDKYKVNFPGERKKYLNKCEFCVAQTLAKGWTKSK